MKTEDLKAQGLTDEQIAFVMAENGKDINRKEKGVWYWKSCDTSNIAIDTSYRQCIRI